MKIEPTGDIEKTDKSQNFKSIDFWKIQFKDSEVEENYQMFLYSRESEYIQKIRNLLVFFGHLILVSLYLITYLLQLEGDNVKNSIKFRLVLVVFCIIVTFTLVLVQLKYPKNVNSCFSAVGYTIFCAVIVLNSKDFQEVLFNDSSSLHLNPLPGLIILVFLYSFSTFSTFFVWLGCNIVILVLFGTIRIRGSSSLAAGILEFFLLFLSILTQQSVIYITSLTSRMQYLLFNVPNADYHEKANFIPENLENKLKKCIEGLKNIVSHSDLFTRSELENAIQLLSAISELRTSNNTEFNLENIVNGLDEDDRLYIQQSWTNFQIVNIRKREKVKNKSLNKSVYKGINPDILLIIKQLGISWNINTFDLNTKAINQPILHLGKYAFEMFNLLNTFIIPEDKLCNFLHELQIRYKPNPYHNAVHAADILGSGLYLINSSFIQSSLTDLEMVSVILAHLAHDVGHPGYTNRFLINFQDDLALQYNDISVLENMHASVTFSITRDDSCNILSGLEKDQYILTRKWIIELILATDMGKHFDLLRLFKANSYEKKSFEVQDIRLEVLKILIKAADIGHSAKITEIHKKWSFLISEEFFRQGDIEKESGKPISMYCDRETTIVAKSQIGFLKNIALPLYESLGGFLASEGINKNCVDQIKLNISAWEFECSNGKNLTMKDSQVKSILSDNSESAPLFLPKSSLVLMCKSNEE